MKSGIPGRKAKETHVTGVPFIVLLKQVKIIFGRFKNSVKEEFFTLLCFYELLYIFLINILWNVRNHGLCMFTLFL